MSLAKFILASVIVAAFSTPGFSKTAPEMKISGSDLVTGKEISVDMSRGKTGTVLLFLSATCPCSASHESLLKELKNKFPQFTFIGVHSNSDEDPAAAKTHFEKARLNFPILQDSNTRLADLFGALKTPHAFVVSPKGEILYRGGVTDTHNAPTAKIQFLKDALTDVTLGRNPKVAEGRTLGCAIARN